MTSSFSSTHLGDCLRAAEADADRAPAPWHGAPRGRGSLLAAGFALLAIGAAGVLALGPVEDVPEPPVPPAVQGSWFTPTPSDDDAPDATPVPATATKPPALVTPVSPGVLDGGDLDVAESMPASVLTAQLEGGTPQVAPMNVPAGPDEHAAATGEFDVAPAN